MESQTLLIQSLREAGLRLTPQRLAICRALAENTTHPSAQSIFEKLRPDYPSLSLTTVYNTLETLVSLGVINYLGNDMEGAARYDADTSPHVNLVCVSCHKIIDFDSPHVRSLEADVKSNSGYQITGASVIYYGLCEECREQAGG